MANIPEIFGDELKHLAITGSNIELLRDQNLGKGAYGRVYKARYRGSLCAAKEIHSILIEAAYTTAEKQSLLDSFIRECYHCSKLNHPKIVKFVGIYHPPQQLLPVMIMELMDQSLTSYAEKQNINFKTKLSILHDVAEGLNYLHSYPVIHRDLSPNNVLLKLQPSFPVAKIADLGVAKILKVDDINSRKYLTTMPGTVDFMAPEAYGTKPSYDTSLDVFSYGGIILHTVNGVWPRPTELTKYDTIKRKPKAFSEVERRQQHLDKMTGEAEVLRPLVEMCLDNDPDKRPTMNELSKKIKNISNQENSLEAKVMEILLQQNYHAIITDIQQQLDSKEAQITNLSEQIQQNSANMQAQEVKTQELRMEVQTQRVEIQALQVELQEKSKDLQEKTKDLQEKTKDLQEKTKDLQDKTNEFLEQRLQMQKELNEKTVGLANCIKEIESIKTNLAANQEKLQGTMTLPQSQNNYNSEKGHKFNRDSQLLGSSNANEAEEVLPYIPISSTNKTVEVTSHKEKPIKEAHIVQAPPEPVSQPPIAMQVPEPQLILSTTSATARHTDNKDQGHSSESRLYTSKDPIKNVSGSVTSSDKDIKKKNIKESTGNEPSFALRKSFSVSNFRVIDSSSRSVSGELQQKLNKRLSKESEINALEKSETTVKQNMGKSKAIAKSSDDVNLDKGDHNGVTEKEDEVTSHKEKPIKEAHIVQAPSEPKPVSQPPIAMQVSEPQLITSATAQHTDNKDQGPSSESILYNSKDPINNVSESVISSNKNIKNKSTKESTGNEPSFALRKSFSVSNFRVIDSSSRSVIDELQQKLNKRLNKEADVNALEKLETTVKQNMGKSKITAKNTDDANPDKGKHDGVTEKEEATNKGDFHKDKPDKEFQTTLSPIELATQLPPLGEDLPLVIPFSEPQQIPSATYSNTKGQGSSSDSESKKLDTDSNPAEKVFKSATIDSRNVKGLTTYESTFPRRRSASVSSTSSSRSGESSTRRADDELQQKLNKRLSKESDVHALEKFESAVQQNMSQTRAITGTKLVSTHLSYGDQKSQYGQLGSKKDTKKQLSSQFLAQKPKTFRLNRIVIPKIMDHWKDVAYYSLCYDVSIVKEIEERCAKDPKQCCSDILKDWLNTKNGISPKTWETLLTQLKEVEELKNKVEEIKQELNM